MDATESEVSGAPSLRQFFSSKAVNPSGVDGLLHGNFELLRNHLIGIGAVTLYAALGTWVILNVIQFVAKLRAEEEEETLGLDESLHGECAYNIYM